MHTHWDDAVASTAAETCIMRRSEPALPTEIVLSALVVEPDPSKDLKNLIITQYLIFLIYKNRSGYT